MSNANADILQMKESLVLDGGMTDMLLSELNNTYYPIGFVIHDLYKYSPLSDTVLVTFMNNWISNIPGVFTLIMRKNLPVSKHVAPLFMDKLQNMPFFIKRYLAKLHADNPYAVTPEYYQRMIDYNNLTTRLVVMEGASFYADSLYYNPDSLTHLYEMLGDVSYGIALYGDYLSKGDYNKADSMATVMYQSGMVDNDWIRLSDDYIAYRRDSILPDSSEYVYIDAKAHECDGSLTGSLARIILSEVYNRTILCNEEGGSMEKSAFAGNGKTTDEPVYLFVTDIYPNPFDKQVTVKYDMPEGLDAELKVFDGKGRLIYSKEIPAGEGKMEIPAKNWQSGTYLCSVYVEGELIETHKLIKQ